MLNKITKALLILLTIPGSMASCQEAIEPSLQTRKAYLISMNKDSRNVLWSLEGEDGTTIKTTLTEQTLNNLLVGAWVSRKRNDIFRKYGFKNWINVFPKNNNAIASFKISEDVRPEASWPIPTNREAYNLLCNDDRNFLLFTLNKNNGTTQYLKFVTFTKEMYKLENFLDKNRLKPKLSIGINKFILSFANYNNINLVYSVTENGFLPGEAKTINEVVKKAKAGNRTNQLFLYDYYINGEYVEANSDKALIWLRMAADKGHIWSQIQLGGRFLIGKSVKKDFSEAEKWYRKAAIQGDSGAQFCLSAVLMALNRQIEAEAWMQIGQQYLANTVMEQSEYDTLAANAGGISIVMADQRMTTHNQIIAKLVKSLKLKIKNNVELQKNDPSDWYTRVYRTPTK